MPGALRSSVPSAVRIGAWKARYICELPSIEIEQRAWRTSAGRKFLLYHWRSCGFGCGGRAARGVDTVTRLRRQRSFQAVRIRRRDVSCRSTAPRPSTSTVRVAALECAARHVVRHRSSRDARSHRAASRSSSQSRQRARQRASRCRGAAAAASFIVRVDVDNIERLPSTAPFSLVDATVSSATASCSSIEQASAHAAGKSVGDVGWTGNETGRIPHAPAEQDRLSQRRCREPESRQHPGRGNSRSAIASRA